MNIYLANTSRGVIDKLIDADLTKRHFVKWDAKAKKKAIDCVDWHLRNTKMPKQ